MHLQIHLILKTIFVRPMTYFKNGSIVGVAREQPVKCIVSSVFTVKGAGTSQKSFKVWGIKKITKKLS